MGVDEKPQGRYVKERADRLLVDRGLVVSRERAKALIMAGEVVAGDHKVDKPGQLIDTGLELRIKSEIGRAHV